MKKVLSVILAASLAFGLLTGCSGNQKPVDAEKPNQEVNNPSDSNSNEPGELDENQYLNYSLMGDPKVIDTTQTNFTTDLVIACNTTMSLTRLQKVDGNLAAQPYGAKSWTVSDDGLVYTFTLNEAQWEDGVPVTAQHYVDAIRRTLDPQLASPASSTLYVIKNAELARRGDIALEELGVKAIDDLTLEITLENPVPYFMDLTYSPAYSPVRLDVIEKSGSKYGTDVDTLISCGAYKLAEWVHDSHLKLVKNETYFEADKVNLKEINFKIIKDSNSIMSELYTGGIDRASVSNVEWREKMIQSGKFNYGDYILSGTHMLVVNTAYEDNGVKLLSNAKIRRAISACIDREEAGSLLNADLAVPATGLVASTISVGGENFREATGYNGTAWNAEITDPKALFIEGLNELGADPDPSKYSIKYLVRSTTATSKDNAEYFYEIFKNAIGFDLEIVQVESSVGRDMTKNGDFGITNTSIYADYNDPYSLLETWISANNVSYNNGWKNEEFDKLLLDSSSVKDMKERANMLAKAEKILVEDDCVIIPIFHPMSSMMTAKYVYGFNNEASMFAPTLFSTVYTSGRE